MGAWGVQPFDSDQALDAAADMMTTPRGVIVALRYAEKHEDELVALAVAYVMALALTPRDQRLEILDATQSEGTTLFPTIAGVEVDPFVPEEIAAVLREQEMQFSAEHCARAQMLVSELCLSEEQLDGWKSSDERKAVVESVLERLEQVMPDVSAQEPPAEDDDCL